jgi:hypothetical protein
LGTKFLITLLGAAAGLWLGIWSLIRLTRGIDESEKKDGKDSREE